MRPGEPGVCELGDRLSVALTTQAIVLIGRHERPQAPELTFTDGVAPADAADAIVAWLIAHDIIL